MAPPPKSPGQIPDPELPRDPDEEPERKKRRKSGEAEPEAPAEKLPRVSPATRRPRPKEKPYSEDNPDVVE